MVQGRMSTLVWFAWGILSLFPSPVQGWEGNSFLNLTRAIKQGVNRTQCWICIHTPTYLGQGVPLVGVPIPLNRTLQTKLWANTTFNWNVTIQIWSIDMVAQGNYALCVSRRKGIENTVFVGNFVGCKDTTQISSGAGGPSTYSRTPWPVPEGSGWYWLCNHTAYKVLPAGWCGTCTLGAIVPAVTVHQNLTRGEIRNLVWRDRRSIPLNPLSYRPKGFHSFVRWFLPWLGVSELEKAIVNISAALELMANATADALSALQIEVTQLSQTTLQNRLALDYLLANQGGVCALVNSSCCVFVNQHHRVETDIHILKQQAALFHHISLDTTSTGFQEVWDWLTSWLPDVGTWGRRILYLLFLTVIVFALFFVCLQCCSMCCRQLLTLQRGYSAPI
ncbi:unnamed protein product [Eretmochelys imbricata]